jgi:pimeloyl-ACP methyl ester carboxylesterase
MSTQPSELAIYTSKFLTEYERRFFIDNLEIQSIEFSGESNCQIFCRTLIHDPSKPFTGQFGDSAGSSLIQRGSATILCLHAFAKMTTSWTWIKVAVTLFRQGFNVVMVDLPGFGKSSISRDIRCPTEAWRRWEVPIMTTLVNDLGLKKVNMLACYQSASIFFHILQEYPQLLGKNHILHNVRVSVTLHHPLLSRSCLTPR